MAKSHHHSDMFKHFYKFPLEPDKFLKSNIICSSDNYIIAFNVCYDSGLYNEDTDELDSLVYKVLDRLNGKTKESLNVGTWAVDSDDDTLITLNNSPTFLIRGWGSLIGNVYKLPYDFAVAIQEEFARFIVDTLNN